MAYAFKRMKQELQRCDDIEAMSRLYEEAKMFCFGENNSVYGKHWKLSDTSRKNISHSKLGSKNPMFGKKRSKEACEKTSKALIGHTGHWCGAHWYNNGVKSVLAFKCPDGYVAGKLYRKRVSK